MRDVDGLPFRDVAALLGISENTAMKRILEGQQTASGPSGASPSRRPAGGVEP